MLSDSKIQRLQVNVYIYERPGQCATVYTNNIASEKLSFCGNALSLSKSKIYDLSQKVFLVPVE